MPERAKRPCRHPGCGALVCNKDGLCPLHLAQYRKQVNERRGTSTAERGYGGAWRKACAAYLRAHPLCECAECKAQQGRVLPATVVDHIKPHRGDMTLFWDRTNWQAMSKRCHDYMTVTQGGGFGRAPRTR
ncbi:HNH endonuclease signature motif containing protein [Cupriavidus necator]